MMWKKIVKCPLPNILSGQVCKLYKVVNFDDTDRALSDGRMISIQCEELTQELTLNLRYDDDGEYKLQ